MSGINLKKIELRSPGKYDNGGWNYSQNYCDAITVEL